MRRLLSILFYAYVCGAPAIAASAASPARATVIMLGSAADPQSSLADVRCLDVALRAPFEIGAPARALRAHADARFAIALAPAYANAFACAASDPLGAASRATGARSDPRTRDVLTLLASMPPLTTAAAAMPGARELASLTSASQRWLTAAAGGFNPDDIRRAAALDAAVRSANAGSGAARALLAHPPAMTSALFNAAQDALRGEVVTALGAGRAAAARGSLEFVATPDGAPVLPLLVDSGGKTISDASALPLNAAADAGVFVDEAIAGIQPLDGGRGAGVLAPFGAYDDASAQLIAARGARYAVFSDRVLQTSQAGGSVAALRAAQASSYMPYALQIGKASALPLLFWADDSSRALDALATSFPPEAFAARVMTDARTAGATSYDGSSRVITLRVQMGGPWAQRADAAAVVDRLAIALARSSAATPTSYLAAHHRAMASAYGFAPGCTLGALDAFTASPNQAAMWTALAQARVSAGGDDALKKATIREPLLRAESGSWYLVPQLPLGSDQIKSEIDAFRFQLSAVYAAAGKPVPARIAPMRTSTPAPAVATPTPAATKPARRIYPQAL